MRPPAAHARREHDRLTRELPPSAPSPPRWTIVLRDGYRSRQRMDTVRHEAPRSPFIVLDIAQLKTLLKDERSRVQAGHEKMHVAVEDTVKGRKVPA